MAIEKINFNYPPHSAQSVYDGVALSSLELSAITSKKVDECIELVNGVEQSAIEATAIVDNMSIIQEQFVTDNNDITSTIIQDTTALLEVIKTDLTTDKNTFIDGLTTDKNTFVATITGLVNNSSSQITTDINTKIDGLVTNGTMTGLIENIVTSDIIPQITVIEQNALTKVEKGEVIYNVKDYGAKGDFDIINNTGTDDAIAIRTALRDVNSKGGGTLLFPSGVYRFTLGLYEELNNMRLIGYGATLFLDFTTPYMHLLVLSGNNVTIEGFHFTSNETYYGLGSGGGDLLLIRGSNYKIYKNIFSHAPSFALLFHGAKNSVADSNYLYDCNVDGIHCNNGSLDIVISNNILTNMGDDAISVVWNNIETEWCGRVLISNNKLDKNKKAGINVCHAKNVVIQGNQITNNDGSGIHVYNWDRYTDSAEDIVVKDNTISMFGANSLGLTQPSPSGIFVSGAKNLIIKGNTIQHGQAQGYLSNGIYLGNYDGCLIENNIFDTMTGRGIVIPPNVNDIQTTLKDIIIKNNVFKNINGEGVSLTPTNLTVINATIIDNVFFNCALGVPLLIQVNGTGSNKLKIINNNNMTDKIKGVGVANSGDTEIYNNTPSVWENYIPNVYVSSGSLVGVVKDCYFKRDKDICYVYGKITITDNGTGAGVLTVTLPKLATLKGSFTAREIAITGVLLNIDLNVSSGINIEKYDGTYPFVNGSVIKFNGWYELA